MNLTKSQQKNSFVEQKKKMNSINNSIAIDADVDVDDYNHAVKFGERIPKLHQLIQSTISFWKSECPTN